MDDPWSGARGLREPGFLPPRAEVAVVGAGPAGLTVALLLAQEGVDVVVLEAREQLGLGSFGLGPGLAMGWLHDHPHRLFASLGEEETRSLLAFIQRNHELADSLLGPSGAWRPCRGLVLPGGPREVPEVRAGIHALAAEAPPAWSPGRVREELGLTIPGPARCVPHAAQYHPVRCLRALAQRATRAGARIVAGCTVHEVDAHNGAPAVRTEHGELVAELVVLAGGASGLALDHSLESFSVSLLHHATLASVSGMVPPPGLVVSAWSGLVRARGVADGAWLVAGGRDAAAATRPETQSAIQRLQLAFLSALAGSALTEPVRPLTTWSVEVAHTRDGLPMIGPVPGKVRVVLCSGFNGHDADLAFEAASATTCGILEGRPVRLPRCLESRRCLR